MRLLLTGATGFLGKRVLNLLVDEPTVERIHVTTRRPRSHPDPKVQVHAFDLIEPWASAPFADQLHEIDAVIHLAGLYDFSKGYGENYQQNVLPTVNLVDWIRSRRNGQVPTLVFASTYAVGAGLEASLGESRIERLPPDSRPYAHTKAIAEKLLVDSGLPVRALRLGILVGDSETGEIEKIDGPYALMRLLSRLKRLPGIGLLSRIPVPADPRGVLPLVPVDAAARAIVRSALLPQPSGGAEVFGVYRPDSLEIGALTEAIFSELLPGCQAWFVKGGELAPKVARVQQAFTRIPTELFRFALEPLPLECPRFREVFGPDAIPPFELYRSAFFRGFHFGVRHARS